MASHHSNSLLDLPNELLIEIARQSVPASFPGLFLSCKRVHQLCKQIVPDYIWLRRFRKFSYKKRIEGVRGKSISYPWELLYNIALEPRITDAIEVADLKLVDPSRAISSAFDPNLTALKAEWGEAEVRRGLKQLFIDHRSLWDTAGVNEDVLMQLIFEDSNQAQLGTADAFLLALLSNVHTLALDPVWLTGHCVEEGPGGLIRNLTSNHSMLTGQGATDIAGQRGPTMRRLMSVAIKRACSAPNTTTPLSNLKEILPQAVDTFDARDPSNDFGGLVPFFAIPSLEKVELTACIWRDGEQFVDFELPEQFPGIRSLILQSATLKPERIMELVERMPQLQALKLDYEQETAAAAKMGWKIGELVRTLGRSVGQHLRVLHLKTPNWPERIGAPATSFADLRALQDLEVDINILHPRTMSGNFERNSQEGASSIAPLTEIMPASLRRLRLQVRMSAPYRYDSTQFAGLLESLFAGFSQRSPDVLPGVKVELLQTEALRRFKGYDGPTRDLLAAVVRVAQQNPAVQVLGEAETASFQQALLAAEASESWEPLVPARRRGQR